MKKLKTLGILFILICWAGMALAKYEIDVSGKLDKVSGVDTITDFDPTQYGGINWGDKDIHQPFTWWFESAEGDSKPAITFGDGEFIFNQPVTVMGLNSRYVFKNGMEWNGDLARNLCIKGGVGTNNETFCADNDQEANTLIWSSPTGGNLWDMTSIGFKSTALSMFGNISVGTYGASSNIIAAAGNVSIGTAYAVAKTAPANGMIVEGNVGVGTWIPATKMQVVGTISATAFQTVSTTAGTISLFEDGANGSNKINFVAPSSVASDRTCTLEDDDTPLDGCVSAGSSGWTDGGTGVWVSTTTDNVGIGTSVPDGGLLTVGSRAISSGAIPTHINLGSDLSTTAGQNLKLKIYDAPSGQDYGFGVSSGRMDYTVSTTTDDHAFYGGSNLLAVIRGGGNVGIGTFNPTVKFQVNDSDTTVYSPTAVATANISVVNPNTTVNNMSQINYVTGTSTGVLTSAVRTGMIVTDHTNGSVDGDFFITTKVGDTLSERLRTKGTNVGIGTTEPIALLHVGGDTRIGNGTFTNTSANEDLYVEGNLEVDGTVQASSLVSSDGSVGVTGATCTAWKNGLCTSL